ncbi:hypothetical protein GCM10023231_34110 [Olivibacter ginsenosidimutans]|uniref:Flavodoxin-like fold domain-containing protein n=1 Tax=Olivibacter ginsenosidimutans TaxID=1176537 RepID=A0ABP9C351_9SPHI
MNNVLVINASARKERSLSRYMTNVFVEVGQEHIPHITEKWIAAAFKLVERRTAEDIEALSISDQLITELKDADILVLGTPMYNWSVPSALKAYIDQVLRVNYAVQKIGLVFSYFGVN